MRLWIVSLLTHTCNDFTTLKQRLRSNWYRGVALFFFLTSLPLAGQVVINEIVAAASDRQLDHSQPGYPRLGITPQWYMPDYNDSLWKIGNGPFGFGTFTSITYGVNTAANMQNRVPTLYVRKVFNVTAAQATANATVNLAIRYNDGFIAFLNGKEVTRRNMGNPGMFAYRDQTAFNANLSNTVETISLGLAKDLLQTGENYLCIQTHNKAVTGSFANDLLCLADLYLQTATPVTLVANNSQWRYFFGAMEPSGGMIDYGVLDGLPLTATWATISFNDSSWPLATGPFGYDTRNQANFNSLGTNLTNELYGKAVSLYSRILFSATEAEAASTAPLMLNLDYDDGVIIYINGIEVTRRNMGASGSFIPFDATTSVAHNPAGTTEAISLAPANTILAPGYNLLAIQNHNTSKTSTDLIAIVSLATTGANSRTLVPTNAQGRYFVGVSEPVTEDDDTDDDLELDPPDSESDWIELHNLGTTAVTLTGWSLTDSAAKPRKWVFPANSSIPAKGYLVVLATGYDLNPSSGAHYLHTNFKLSKEGEYLALFDANETLISEIAPTYPLQTPWHAYIRTANGTYAYCDKATPGAANSGNTFSAITTAPTFSHLGGHYPGSISVQLTAPEPQSTIRYTQDGSTPSESNGQTYTGPIAVSSIKTVRARCFKTGQIPSATTTHTYLIGQSVARRSIAAISLVGDHALTFYGKNANDGPVNGQGIFAIKDGVYIGSLWTNNGNTAAFNIPMLRGRASERPASFEFYPTNGNPLRTDLGLRLSGSNHARPRYIITDNPNNRFSPTSATQKPSFNIFFRGELGESLQEYPYFFEDSRVSKFHDIRIRAGKNDISNPFIRDELVRRIFIGTGQKGSRGIFASVYINGVWKGYYNFCEHLREAFMQQHFGGNEAWDVRQVGEYASGDALSWNRMMSYLRTNDLTNTSKYLGVADHLDIDNYIDYILVNGYAATWDWPNNNWVGSCERSPAGRWRFFIWDAEGGFGVSTKNDINFNIFTSDLTISDAQTTTSRWIPAIYTLLKVSPEFRQRFADRTQKHLFNKGCLTLESMSQQFITLRNQINPIMQETINATVNQSFYNTWIVPDTRRNIFFMQLSNQGLWNAAVLAPNFSQYGGDITTNTLIAINNPNTSGTIYWSTNGIDPRAPGGAITGNPYSAPLRFDTATTLMARILGSNNQWSPLQEATFTFPYLMPFFLPPTSADWTSSGNWSTFPLPYPNAPGAIAMLDAPQGANREVKLRAPVTVGEVLINQGESSLRNKIGDSGTSPLTFAATNQSQTAYLTINGSGTGYVEFEVKSDVILDANLLITINNVLGNAEYGALRLRSNWRGSGGIIKDGVGLVSFTGDSKSYSGATTIKQGVLAFTEPAAPFNSAVTVNPGGQLRLTSSSSSAPRVYQFNGAITLNSLGRGGDLPASSGLGLLGALRYQPDSNSSTAIINNEINFNGHSAIHVEKSSNTLILNGALKGSHSFMKTGGGTLILNANSHEYYQPSSTSNGTLIVNGRLISPIEISQGARLGGWGKVGPIRGDGVVNIDKTILTSPTAIGLNYAFAFSDTLPAWQQPADSANSLLRLLSIVPTTQPATIDIHFDMSHPGAGALLQGGLFVECGSELHEVLAKATFNFYLPDVNGGHEFAGRAYSPMLPQHQPTVSAQPINANFGDGSRSGLIMTLHFP